MITTLTSAHSKLNSRQRLVLLNALKGMNQTDAYEAVYGHSPASYKAASNLFLNVHFKAELDKHLTGQLQEWNEQTLSKSEKRTILASIARAQLIDLIDDDGNLKIDRNSPAVKALKEYYRKVRLDRDGNPIITSSAKLLDPLAAIMEDNKMTGDYAPSKHLHGHRVQFDVNMVERRKRIEE